MKTLRCEDIDPDLDCDFEAKGANDEEVISKMMKHIKSEHPDKLMGITTADMKDKLKQKITEE